LDPKIKKTVKVNVFNEATLHHVRHPVLCYTHLHERVDYQTLQPLP
jgi:hypothetical protein